MSLPSIQLKPGRAHLFGATPAQEDMASVLGKIADIPDQDVMLVLNLSGVESVSGSYLRASALWAFLCGQAYAKQEPLANLMDPWGIRPLPIYPVFQDCSQIVTEDVHDFFAQRNLPAILVPEGEHPHIEKAILLGKLDGFLASTLRVLSSLGEATAAQLAEASQEKITVNGWSNRLADLFVQRLVTRRRSGKYWIYSPLIRRFALWA